MEGQTEISTEEQAIEHKKRIVVVDDEEFICSALKETLSENYIVYTAENGVEGLRLIKNVLPDLVIMDVLMPIMDGLEATRRMKADKQTAVIPIIFLTAKNQIEDAEQGFKSGCDSYMIKPFSPSKLIQKISELLDLADIRKSFAS